MEIYRRINRVSAIFRCLLVCLFCQACTLTDPSVPEESATGAKMPTVTSFFVDKIYKRHALVYFSLDISNTAKLYKCTLYYSWENELPNEKEFSLDLTEKYNAKEVTVELQELNPNTTYNCRLYFETEQGSSYSHVIRFTTKATTDGQAWEKFTDMHFINDWYSYVHVEAEYILFPGSSTEKDAIWQFTPSLKTWEYIVDIIVDPKEIQVFNLNDSIYYGLSYVEEYATYHTALFKYFPQIHAARHYANVPYACDYPLSIFPYENKIYYAGCRTLNEDFTTYVMVYDPFEKSWTRKMDFPGKKLFSTCTVVAGNRVFILGGRNKKGDDADFSNRLWEYIPDTDTWLIREPFPGGGRYDMRGFAIEDKAYFGYGMERINGEVVRMNDLWVYDPTEDSWEICSSFEQLNDAEITHSFGYNGEGYIGTSRQELWKYSPEKDK